MKGLTYLCVAGGLQSSSCQPGHHGGYQAFARRDLLHDGGGGEGGWGGRDGSIRPGSGATLSQRVGGHGVSPGRHGRDQAGGRRRRLEGQPGHHGEERVGGGQSTVGESQGHWHVAGQRLRQQAGHALASDGQRGRRLGGVD